MTKNISRRNLTFGASMAAFLTGCGGGGDSLVPESTSAMPGAPRMNAQTTGVAEVEYEDLLDTPLAQRMSTDGSVGSGPLTIIADAHPDGAEEYLDEDDSEEPGEIGLRAAVKKPALKKPALPHYVPSVKMVEKIRVWEKDVGDLHTSVRAAGLAVVTEHMKLFEIILKKKLGPVDRAYVDKRFKEPDFILYYKNAMRKRFAADKKLLLILTTLYQADPAANLMFFYNVINHHPYLHERLKLITELFSWATYKKYITHEKHFKNRATQRHLQKKSSPDSVFSTPIYDDNGKKQISFSIQINDNICPIRRKELIRIGENFTGSVYPFNHTTKSIYLAADNLVNAEKEASFKKTKTKKDGTQEVMLITPTTYVLDDDVLTAIKGYCKEARDAGLNYIPDDQIVYVGSTAAENVTGVQLNSTLAPSFGDLLEKNATLASQAFGNSYIAYSMATPISQLTSLFMVSEIRALMSSGVINLKDAIKAFDRLAVRSAPGVANYGELNDGNLIGKSKSWKLWAVNIAAGILTYSFIQSTMENMEKNKDIIDKDEKLKKMAADFKEETKMGWRITTMTPSLLAQGALTDSFFGLRKLISWNENLDWTVFHTVRSGFVASDLASGLVNLRTLIVTGAYAVDGGIAKLSARIIQVITGLIGAAAYWFPGFCDRKGVSQLSAAGITSWGSFLTGMLLALGHAIHLAAQWTTSSDDRIRK